MKHFYFLLITLVIASFSFGQSVIWSETFETGNSGTPSDTCNDGGGDFFTRTDGTDIGSYYEVLSPEGSFWFAAMDLDGDCSGPNQTLIFSGISIASYTDLGLKVLLAEDDDSTNEDWDANTSFRITASIDGGAETTLLAVEAEGGTNTKPRIDTDFDGIGDGAEITPTFTEYEVSISGTGSTLVLNLYFDALDAGDEDISVDNIRVYENFSLNTNENELSASFSLYPNPTALGYVTVNSASSQAITAQVFDVLGKQVIHANVLNNRLDVSTLQAGIYIVKLTQDNAVATKKLVIK